MNSIHSFTLPLSSSSSLHSPMELDSENMSSNQLVISSNYGGQIYKKDEFQFQIYSSRSYLQDYHHLDHFNPVFDDGHNPCFEAFAPYSYGGSSNNIFEDPYECKPRVDQVMDNFESAGECYDFNQRNRVDNFFISDVPLMNFQEMIVKPVNFLVPDEVSCVTSANPPTQLPSLMRTCRGRKKPNVIKGQWTVEEDRLLVQLVEQYGVRKWSHIAQMLPGRIGKQCRERWHNHLRPDIKKDTWTEEEDRVLIQAHAEIGNKWAEIAKRLPGRTENSIKNHWNATKRRQYSKRKCRSKYPRCSLLQDYIKSLNLDSNATRHQKKTAATSAVSKKMKSPDDHALTSAERAAACLPGDDGQLVRNFNGEMEFCLDDNMFGDGCSVESLIDDVSYGNEKQEFDTEKMEFYCVNSYFIENKLEVDRAAADLVAEYEVKKELDLVEMISQVSAVNKLE